MASITMDQFLKFQGSRVLVGCYMFLTTSGGFLAILKEPVQIRRSMVALLQVPLDANFSRANRFTFCKNKKSFEYNSNKFCGKAQFLHSFGLFTLNYAKTVPFHKISTLGNYVKLRYFM